MRKRNRFDFEKLIIHHPEGVDLIPANIELSGVENMLLSVNGREQILRFALEPVKDEYDYIIIDCMPSLGTITANALVSADSVLIPVQAAYLPVKGLQDMFDTIVTVKTFLNPNLEIEGIFFTMVDSRTNFSKEVIRQVRDIYEDVRVFETVIPHSVKAVETSAIGKSIYMYNPKGKVATAYEKLTEEVMDNER
ncbi:MAG: ParA family protein [Holdemanella sp.]|nr:ParA family protein [Holdemanella sp.]